MENPANTHEAPPKEGRVAQQRRRFEDMLAPSQKSSQISLGRQNVQAGGGTVRERKPTPNRPTVAIGSFRAPFEVQVCHDHYCRVLSDYTAKAEGELSLRRGDTLQVVRLDPEGWCEGNVVGGSCRRGRFPSRCVERVLLDPQQQQKPSSPLSPSTSSVSSIKRPPPPPPPARRKGVLQTTPAPQAASPSSSSTTTRPLSAASASPKRVTSMVGRPLPTPPRASVVTHVLAQCQQLVNGCMELKEAAVAATSAPDPAALARWSAKGEQLNREADELRKKARELKKQSSANKYGTEEQIKKDMRLYLQHKKSIASFHEFTEDLTTLTGRSIKLSIAVLTKGGPAADSAEVEELDRAFASVADSVKELVLAMQSWNLNVKNKRQLEKNSAVALSYRTLCTNAHTMGDQLMSLARNNEKQEFIKTAKEMLNTLDTISEYSATAGLVHEGVTLKRLMHQLLSTTQCDLGAKGSLPTGEQIDKMQELVDGGILAFLDALSSALQSNGAPLGSQEGSTASASDGAAPWSQQSGPVALLSPPVLSRERSLSSPPSLEHEEEHEKREKTRANVLKEVVTTETVYLAQLKTLLSAFIAPLKAQKWGQELLASDDLLNRQFVCWAGLVNLSQELLTELEARTAQASGDKQKVGDVFQRLLPKLKSEYQHYINNYDLMRERIRQLRIVNSDFTAHVQSFCAAHGGADLGFYLICPIQRIPRYEMLISNLAKHTAATHPDSRELSATLDKLKELLVFLDETKRREDNKRKVQYVLSHLSTPKHKLPRILSEEHMKDRVFLREGLLYETYGRKRKERYVFMFDEFLIKTSIKMTTRLTNNLTLNLNRLGFSPKDQKPALYVYKDIIPFSKVFLSSEDEDDWEEGMNVRFKLIERNPAPDTVPCVQTFTCSSENECQSWMKDISEAINLSSFMVQVVSSSMIVRRK